MQLLNLRMRNIIYFLSFILSISLLSCNKEKEEIKSLYFDKEYYEKPLLDIKQSIQFQGNADKYEILVENTKILEASIKEDKLEILTKKKGATTIYLRNSLANETESISIKVIDSYMGLSVERPISSSLYAYSDKMFFINNKTNDVYWYDDSFKLKKKGNYNFYLKDEKFYLSLSFDKDSIIYDISNSSNIFLFKVLLNVLDISWSKLTSREISPINIVAININSSEKTYFSLSKDEMPYNTIY